MNWHELIPLPDALPAPWWVFEGLGVLTFVVHILFINTVVGSSLIALIVRLRPLTSTGAAAEIVESNITKIPSLIALSVTLGVAPLLFVQVLYGPLVYSSSVLMAVYWILVIPILISGYYGAYVYVQSRRHSQERSTLATIGLAALVAAMLYVGFMLTNNMTLMLTPEKWTAYFQNRGGTVLNLNDPTVYLRFLHFLTASIAVSGLFAAIVWHFRKKHGSAKIESRAGLRLFAFASMFQVLVGILLLAVLPTEYSMLFLGHNAVNTLILFCGIAAGIAAIVIALRGNLWLTVSLLVTTVAMMGVSRVLLRDAYLDGIFAVENLKVEVQYSPLIAFLVILVLGLAVVGWMIKAAFAAHKRRVVQ